MKPKLKILMPTLREKDRYIKFKVISENGIYYEDLESAVWNTLLDFYGESGVSKFSLWLIRNLWNPDEQTAVIKCNNNSVQEIIAGLGLISRLGDNRLVVKILNVSGTLRKLK